MDKLPINENIDLSTRMHAAVYIGVVKEFNKDTWEITFRVPLIIDNLKKYPSAVPIFHHEYELFPNDEVIVFVTTQSDPTQCYYMPITLYKFIGLKNGINFVDITKNGIIDLETNNFYTFAIENSEHRTLKSRSDISDSHKISTNSMTINIPIDSSDQQDIVNNRTEPTVVSKPIGSQTINVTGTQTSNINGAQNINITGTQNSNIIGVKTEIINGVYTILVNGAMTMGTGAGGSFSVRNVGGNFSYGNTTNDMVNEISSGCIANGYLCLSGKYSVPIYSTKLSSANGAISTVGYLNFNIVNGLLVGFYSQYCKESLPRYTQINRSAYQNAMNIDTTCNINSINSSTVTDIYCINKSDLVYDQDMSSLTPSINLIQYNESELVDYSLSRGSIKESMKSYSNYSFETSDNILIRFDDNDNSNTYGLTGNFVIDFYAFDISNYALNYAKSNIRITTVNGRIIALGYNRGNSSSIEFIAPKDLTVVKSSKRGNDITTIFGSNVFANNLKTITDDIKLYSGYYLTNMTLRYSGTEHTLKFKNGRLIGIGSLISGADDNWNKTPNDNYIVGEL